MCEGMVGTSGLIMIIDYGSKGSATSESHV